MSDVVEKRMVQYSVWPNCNNNCKFCLRKERDSYSLEEQLKSIANIKQNIQAVDWNSFPYGVSLLGGEIFSIRNERLQEEFLSLADLVVQHVLKKSKVGKMCKLSTVTNGIYDPAFLFRVADLVVGEVGTEQLDINFSYDIKYRYKSEEDRKQVVSNINAFHERYDYRVGVQMILTQYLIDALKSRSFSISSLMTEEIHGAILTFLYPHPVATGQVLGDFNFKRSDFLWMLRYLRNTSYEMYLNFIHSTKNSSVFKYTGLKNKFKVERTGQKDFVVDCTQEPVLSDGKEIVNDKCGHSVLYQCYSDSDKCMLCDMLSFDKNVC